MKLLLKVAAGVSGLLFVLIAGLFISLSFYNSRMYAWRVMTLFSSDTQDFKVFHSRLIETDHPTSPIEKGDPLVLGDVQYAYQDETRRENIEDLLERTDTRAFLIVKDDQLVYERYIQSETEDMHTSFSVAKSFTSALIGAAIADGLIGSVNDPVIKYVPELAGRGLDDLTIRNLLRMDTGIRYRSEDDILAPFSDDALTYYSPDLRQIALSVQQGETPIGAAFHYNNFHPLLEGLILERATGMPVAEYLQERIWKPMGAEYPASWSIDSDDSGFEKMESGINARAVDYARFGLMYLHQGYWNDQQILLSTWVAESTSPDPGDERPYEVFAQWKETGGYYGYHWWGIKNTDGSFDYMARGNLGQLIYISPGKQVVAVRLGGETDSGVMWARVVQSIVNQIP
jgi:CubicO group peptidase (beta-lactamase class C family)